MAEQVECCKLSEVQFADMSGLERAVRIEMPPWRRKQLPHLSVLELANLHLNANEHRDEVSCPFLGNGHHDQQNNCPLKSQ